MCERKEIGDRIERMGRENEEEAYGADDMWTIWS
jgi:hypothetical protein